MTGLGLFTSWGMSGGSWQASGWSTTLCIKQCQAHKKVKSALLSYSLARALLTYKTLVKQTEVITVSYWNVNIQTAEHRLVGRYWTLFRGEESFHNWIKPWMFISLCCFYRIQFFRIKLILKKMKCCYFIIYNLKSLTFVSIYILNFIW